MPNKKRYWSIKNDPKRYEKFLKDQREWMKSRRKRRIFKTLEDKLRRDYGEKNIKPFDLWKLAKKQKLRCALTGKKLNRENISLDHKIPISKGGTSQLSNLQFVDKNVNYAKRDFDQNDFIQLCKEVSLFFNN